MVVLWSPLNTVCPGTVCVLSNNFYPKYTRALFWDIHCHNCGKDYHRSIIVGVPPSLKQPVGGLFGGRGSSCLLLGFNLWPSAPAKPYFDHTLPHTTYSTWLYAQYAELLQPTKENEGHERRWSFWHCPVVPIASFTMLHDKTDQIKGSWIFPYRHATVFLIYCSYCDNDIQNCARTFCTSYVEMAYNNFKWKTKWRVRVLWIRC